MKFFATSNEISNHTYTNQLYERLKIITSDREGFGYYKYPVAGEKNEDIPEIILIDKEYGISAINIFEWQIEQILEVEEDEWNVDNEIIDSPLLVLQDYIVNLQSKFQGHRALRNKVSYNTIVVLPLIKKHQFISKFKNIECDNIIFNDYLNVDYKSFWVEKSSFEGETAELFLAVSQGAGPMNEGKKNFHVEKSNKIGEAIKQIHYKIKSLDLQQHAAAIQIPDGPQRIRGMAGTGKTIILTMKAAFLHARYPDKKILYTFHTQALYNQIRNLITMFYRDDKKTDPNWDNLLIRHSWGSRYKEGVYSRTCARNSIVPLKFSRYYDDPLDFVFSDLLKYDLEEEYDFVLIDEAQDFPPSFFKAIYKTTKEPKRIIFAYDELQSLDHIKTIDVDELFGCDEQGKALVDFNKGTYGNDIEMDYVLEKSYRNPLEVLMLAHGIGLGLHNANKIMQVIDDKRIWNSIGYEIKQGNCKENDEMVIYRPAENSISAVHEYYSGDVETIRYLKYATRDEEIQAIADDIRYMVKEEGVLEHNIVVISLSNNNLKENFSYLQSLLFGMGISSISPGIDVDRDEFGVEGSVTLSTVYKAKGNEAFIVYVMGFDYLYDYINFLEARNKAFTSISRSKGWVVLSGVGTNMDRAIEEMKSLMSDIESNNEFRFVFPDEAHIARKLSSEEHARRLQVKKIGEQAINSLLNIDGEFLESLPDEVKQKLLKKIGGQ